MYLVAVLNYNILLGNMLTYVEIFGCGEYTTCSMACSRQIQLIQLIQFQLILSKYKYVDSNMKSVL